MIDLRVPNALVLVGLMLLTADMIRACWQTMAPRTRQPDAEFPVQEFLALMPLIALSLWSMVLMTVALTPVAPHVPLVLGASDLQRSLLQTLGWTSLGFMVLWIAGTRLRHIPRPWQTEAWWPLLAAGLVGASEVFERIGKLQLTPMPGRDLPVTVLALAAAVAALLLLQTLVRAGPWRWRAQALAMVAVLVSPLAGSRWHAEMYFVGRPDATPLGVISLCTGLACVFVLLAYLHGHRQGRERRHWLEDWEALENTRRLAATSADALPAVDEDRIASWIERLSAQQQQRDRLHERALVSSGIGCWSLEPSTSTWRVAGASLDAPGQSHDPSPGSFTAWLDTHLSADEAQGLRALMAYEPGNRGGFEQHLRMRRGGGTSVWTTVRMRGKVLGRDALGYPLQLAGILIEDGNAHPGQADLGAENRLFAEGPVVMMRWLFNARTRRLTDLDFISPNAETLWGHELEDIHAMNRWSQIVSPEDVTGLTRRLQRAMSRHGTDLQHEMRIRLRDDRRVWHSLFARVEIQGEQGVISGFIVDVDAFKRAEQRARDQSRQLQEMIDELQRARTETTILRDSSEFLNSAESLDEAFIIISRAAMAIFPGWGGALASVQADGRMKLTGRWGDAEAFADPFGHDDCWALRRGQTHPFADPATSLRCRHVHPQRQQLERPYLCIPMAAHGENIGSLHLMAPGAVPPAQMQGLVERAIRLGETLKLALSNLRLRSRLKEQATHDALTGLYNRRHLDDQLPVELRRTEREKQPLTLAMLDIDHFKQFNDRFGHEAGDLVLKTLSGLLRSRIRPYDMACRFGGEEIAIIMPGCGVIDAAQKLEHLRAALSHQEIIHEGVRMPTVTVSIGLSESGPGSTAESLIRLADEQLYAAKREGRDQIRWASMAAQPLPPPSAVQSTDARSD